MVLFCMVGIFIGFFVGLFGYIVGGVVGFTLWIFPTMDCSNLAEEAKPELEAENQPYRFRY